MSLAPRAARRLTVLLGLLCARPAWSQETLATDHEQEVLALHRCPLPSSGPQQGLVTIDLFLPLGTPASTRALGLALQVQERRPDVRLVYHPLLSSPIAEVGQEALWEARAQGRFWPLCERLYAHPEVLQPGQEPQLLALAEAAGLDGALLRQALVRHRHRSVVHEIVRRGPLLRAALELWLNGHRLQTLDEAPFFDEIDRQRERARDLLRRGIGWGALYERLLAEEQRGPQSSAAEAARSQRRVLDLAGSPSRGPALTPAVIVLFGSLDSYTTLSHARAVAEVMARRPGQVRLVFKHLPSGPAGQDLALRSAQLALGPAGEGGFWSFFDLLVDQRARRYGPQGTYVRRMLDGAPRVTDAALQQIERDAEQARLLGLPALGGGALVLNGQALRGIVSAETLDALVRGELQSGLVQRLRRRSALAD